MANQTQRQGQGRLSVQPQGPGQGFPGEDASGDRGCRIDPAPSPPRDVGGGLQIRRQRRESADLPWALSLSGRHRREGYPRVRQWSGELPVSRRQERKDGTPDRVRGAFPVAGVAACAAERFPACPQLWLSASEL